MHNGDTQLWVNSQRSPAEGSGTKQGRRPANPTNQRRTREAQHAPRTSAGKQLSRSSSMARAKRGGWRQVHGTSTPSSKIPKAWRETLLLSEANVTAAILRLELRLETRRALAVRLAGLL
jgi:hypothetical protein